MRFIDVHIIVVKNIIIFLVVVLRGSCSSVKETQNKILRVWKMSKLTGTLVDDTTAARISKAEYSLAFAAKMRVKQHIADWRRILGIINCSSARNSVFDFNSKIHKFTAKSTSLPTLLKANQQLSIASGPTMHPKAPVNTSLSLSGLPAMIVSC